MVPPLVSVVVPTYNRASSVARLLEALTRQMAFAHPFEVIVVDDGSTDDTPTVVRGLSLPYPLSFVTADHRGPAAARNLGVERAAGEIVIFLDDDVIPRPGLIAAHVACHRADTALVVIGPMIAPAGWPRSAWVRWEEEKLARQYRELAAGAYPCTPRQFFTANASMRRDVFLEAGGFDARFDRAEDVELAYRLWATGVRFAFEPAAEVVHYARRPFASWRRAAYRYGRNDVVMTRDKGHLSMPVAYGEFRGRHPLNRALAKLCVGRPKLVQAVVAALSGTVAIAARARAPRLTSLALSAIFNVLYWQGVSDELGGSSRLWRNVAGTTTTRLLYDPEGAAGAEC